MAIQIWDAQAGQYKSADLARFGGSGTLTEALVWDGTQYVKVWSATITITPQAPTFLTESPWYTLPTQEGVTYSVTGTPGYNQSVTITATPQAGYELTGQTSWTHTYGPEPLPVVTITGTSGTVSRDQFHAACTQYGVDYKTVQVLPFLLDTSQATNLTYMFNGCSALTTVPDLDISQATNLGSMFRNCSSLTTVPDLYTSQVQYLNNMFNGCSALTDGNVRLIGRHPNATTSGMITGSGLTRLPFYNTNGNPI